MVPEILKYLEVSSGGRYIDCTLGEGGHTKSLLEASNPCLLYTSPSPRDRSVSRMPSSA